LVEKLGHTCFNLLHNFVNPSHFLVSGPTCDSTDVIAQDIDLELLKIGDIIYFNCMGAYTIPLRTPFNGFELTKVQYFIDFNDW
jgi:ornithine decarboxylase